MNRGQIQEKQGEGDMQGSMEWKAVQNKDWDMTEKELGGGEWKNKQGEMAERSSWG